MYKSVYGNVFIMCKYLNLEQLPKYHYSPNVHTGTATPTLMARNKENGWLLSSENPLMRVLIIRMPSGTLSVSADSK